MRLLVRAEDIQKLIMESYNAGIYRQGSKEPLEIFNNFIKKYGVKMEEDRRYAISLVGDDIIITRGIKNIILSDLSVGSNHLFTKMEAMEKMCELYADFSDNELCQKLKLIKLDD